MASGVSALAGAVYLGPGQTFKKEKLSPPHVPFVMLGTALLLFGWFGFNAGSALAADGIASQVPPTTHLLVPPHEASPANPSCCCRCLWQAFLNTHVAAASAMVTWLFCDYWRGNKLSASGACIGVVVGLVGITPAAGFVNTGAAIIIGIVACICSNILGEHMKEKSSIGKRRPPPPPTHQAPRPRLLLTCVLLADDTLDVFSCHGFGGIVGMILTACFADTHVNPLGAARPLLTPP